MTEKFISVVGNKQMNPFRGDLSISPCITQACGAGGGMTPMITTYPVSVLKEKWFIELIRGHMTKEQMQKKSAEKLVEEVKKTIIHLPKSAEGKVLRIRKLTPRECFRLQDVPEEKIDAMMGVDEKGKRKISNSQCYKLAGNSITVAPMAMILGNLLYGSEPRVGEQLELF